MRRARETLEGRGDGGGPRSRSSASESALRGEQTEDRRRSTKGRQPRWHRTLERDGRRGGAGESAPPVCARSRDRAPLLDSPAPKLATRGAMAPSTRSAALATAAAAPAKPSPSVAASNPRKRRQSSPSSATTAAVPATTAARESLGTLAFDDEGDADDADVLAASSDDDGPDAAHEAFPELDLEASDADAATRTTTMTRLTARSAARMRRTTTTTRRSSAQSSRTSRTRSCRTTTTRTRTLRTSTS